MTRMLVLLLMIMDYGSHDDTDDERVRLHDHIQDQAVGDSAPAANLVTVAAA